MKVLLLTPWENAWIPYFKEAFERAGCKFACSNGYDANDIPDVVVHGWAAGYTQEFPAARNIMFLRRFELFSGGLGKVDWSQIDELICVNEWIADRVREVFARRKISTPVRVIYNGTDGNKWRFKCRTHGFNIGMSCHVHPKKNLPLALQILCALPPEYELHIAGEVQDPCTAEYLNHVARIAQRKVYLYGHIPHNQLNLWWENMNYCLSTSISEGNPNNVIEAMAKGIKPIVHNWPGAKDQFDPWTFSTVAEAQAMILSGEYDSAAYRHRVEKRFSLSNFDEVVQIALQLNELEAA